MILGHVHITKASVQTHRDSYLLRNLSVISVRRPFFGGSVLFALGGSGFGLAFADLLYLHEMIGLGTTIAVCLGLGVKLAQIQLLSRDLRGTELSQMIWGSYGHLNRIRAEIVAALEGIDTEDRL